MKIVLTGGGSGGHFYPLIAIAQAVEAICAEKKLIEPQFFYFGPAPFDPPVLLEHDIEYRAIGGSSIKKDGKHSPFGFISTAIAIFRAFPQVFSVYPDVIFSTGGFAAFPTLACARVLKIPVVIYDADAKPGKVSLWSSRFARWIAVAHPDAATLFPQKARDRIARTGHPIRSEIQHVAREGGYEFLKLDAAVPTIFVMGGSQGAQTINEAIIDALPALLEKYNVVHQTGNANIEAVQQIVSVALKGSSHTDRYRPFGLLNALALKMAAGVASLIIARAGSGTIFEVASWNIPSILIPIPEDISHDQTENAFSYARSGAAVVIEQRNLTPHILVAEIDRIMQDEKLRATMSQAAATYSRPEAAQKIAQIIMETALEHEPL